MDRKTGAWIACSVAVGLVSVPFFLPKILAQPLYGDFLQDGVTCACGHLIFYRLEEADAYEYCPGHDDLEWIGPLRRNETSVVITDDRKGEEVLRFNYHSGSHWVTFLGLEGSPESDEFYIEQNTNWYRIFWQKYRR